MSPENYAAGYELAQAQKALKELQDELHSMRDAAAVQAAIIQEQQDQIIALRAELTAMAAARLPTRKEDHDVPSKGSYSKDKHRVSCILGAGDNAADVT